MSQNSVRTCVSEASTIPYELVQYQDDDFIQELSEVDDLYYQDRNDSDDHISEQLSDLNFESDSSDDAVSNFAVEIDIEKSSEDVHEERALAKFRNDGCGCTFAFGKPCSEAIEFENIVENRDYCHELSHNELDLVVKAQLIAHRRSGSSTTAKRHRPKERVRAHQEYFFNGMKICRNTFCFAHAISKKKLEAIAKSLDSVGITPRTHGNTNRMPKNALSVTDRDRIKTFLCEYARDNAMPLPGRLPNFNQSHVLLLPSDKSVSDIHYLYEQLAQVMTYRSVSLKTFRGTWKDLCPHISMSKPSTDLCHKCQVYCAKIARGGLLEEEEKTELLTNYNVHVNSAKIQRDYYREQCRQSKENYLQLPADKQKGNPAASLNLKLHYSWDFAQQVHYPHSSQQCGPIYFKTPRKCNVFGICSEGSGKQVFYLLDEGDCSGKGANEVTSMVHHYFQKHGHGEKHLSVHFDNCTRQNKNNVILWYALWRVLTGLHESVELSMMIAGHTKFDPDWHFGLWKRRWRKSTAETMAEIATTVHQSSRSGHNMSQLVDDPEQPVIFYEWRVFLQNFFKPLKHLTSYHHFTVTRDNPGIVCCKVQADSEEISFNLNKKRAPILESNMMPEICVRPTIEASRQRYLYEEIREFCTREENKDVCCPKPSSPKCSQQKPVGSKRKMEKD